MNIRKFGEALLFSVTGLRGRTLCGLRAHLKICCLCMLTVACMSTFYVGVQVDNLSA